MTHQQQTTQAPPSSHSSASSDSSPTDEWYTTLLCASQSGMPATEISLWNSMHDIAVEQDEDTAANDLDYDTSEGHAEDRLVAIMALWMQIRKCRRERVDALMRGEHGGDLRMGSVKKADVKMRTRCGSKGVRNVRRRRNWTSEGE